MDRSECLRTFGLFGSNPTFMFVGGEPRSKARPRFGGSRLPYDKNKQLQQATLLRNYMWVTTPNLLLGNVAIVCTFYRSSKYRVDIDNLLKEVFDNANGIIWKDDMQVTACLGTLRMDPDFPRTCIAVGQHTRGANLDRSNQDIPAVCEVCGDAFVWRKYQSSKQVGRFYSIACHNKFGKSDLRAPISCKVCEQPFRRRTVTQIICSERCRIVRLAARNRGRSEVREFIEPNTSGERK